MNPVAYYYSHDTRSIVLPEGAPFDGNPVLLKLAEGWVEGYWVGIEPATTYYDSEPEGWLWCCLDDKFQKELDEVLGWLPLLESTEEEYKADVGV